MLGALHSIPSRDACTSRALGTVTHTHDLLLVLMVTCRTGCGWLCTTHWQVGEVRLDG